MSPGASRAPGRVRRAQPGDLERLGALWRVLSEHHAAIDPLFALRAGAESEIRRVLEAQLRDPDTAVFACEREAELVGFCTARIERAPPILQEEQRAQIDDLAVREGLRRRGIGSALVSEALAWLGERGVQRVEVRVAAGNAEGQAFWRERGFGEFMDVLHRRL